jgi:hypothetical protein
MLCDVLLGCVFEQSDRLSFGFGISIFSVGRHSVHTLNSFPPPPFFFSFFLESHRCDSCIHATELYESRAPQCIATGVIQSSPTTATHRRHSIGTGSTLKECFELPRCS